MLSVKYNMEAETLKACPAKAVTSLQKLHGVDAGTMVHRKQNLELESFGTEDSQRGNYWGPG